MNINSQKFHEDNEKFVKVINNIVQTVKGNAFDPAAEAAVIAAGTDAIDALNAMRTFVYDAIDDGFVYNPAAYDDTATVNANVPFEEVGVDIDALQIKLSEQVAIMTETLTTNATKGVINSSTLEIMVKASGYTTPETTLLAAMSDLSDGLFETT